jgi:hypothetical protein
MSREIKGRVKLKLKHTVDVHELDGYENLTLL